MKPRPFKTRAASYAAEAFVASNCSLARLPDGQRDDEEHEVANEPADR